MATIFKAVTYNVTGKTEKTGTISFDQNISGATVTTQGFNVQDVWDGRAHYRGISRLQIRNIRVDGKKVLFDYLYEMAEGPNDHWPMKGTIDFLAIAITD